MDDTIAAIATGTGGGVGIVRVSGPDAEGVLRRLAPSFPVEARSHALHLCRVVDPRSGERLDEALCVILRGPKSYTGEDVAEVQGHGGAVNLARLLAAMVAAGARVAEPGEFSRRAYLSGRLDLVSAEAVVDVIAARSERALRVAQAQLAGALSTEVRAVRAEVIAVLAELEGAIDFPDEQLDVTGMPELGRRLRAAGARAAALSSTYRRGRLVRGGIDVALCGRPNAGKSSLLNALVGEERALVDAEPGTTRDFLEVETEVDGVRVVLVDTAGERDSGTGVEARGRALGRQRRERADVWLVVVDGTIGFSAEDAALVDEADATDGSRTAPGLAEGGLVAGGLVANKIGEGGIGEGGIGEGGVAVGGVAVGGVAAVAAVGRGAAERVVIVWNKRDVAGAARGVPAGLRVVETSALDGSGVEAVRAMLRAMAGDEADDGAPTVTSARQREALDEAAASLGRGAAVLEAGGAEELCAVDVRMGLERLGRVTGESVGSEVLDAIFARFCIGK